MKTMKKKYLIPETNIETIVTGTSLLGPGSPNTENPGNGGVGTGDHIFGGN